MVTGSLAAACLWATAAWLVRPSRRGVVPSYAPLAFGAPFARGPVVPTRGGGRLVGGCLSQGDGRLASTRVSSCRGLDWVAQAGMASRLPKPCLPLGQPFARGPVALTRGVGVPIVLPRTRGNKRALCIRRRGTRVCAGKPLRAGVGRRSVQDGPKQMGAGRCGEILPRNRGSPTIGFRRRVALRGLNGLEGQPNARSARRFAAAASLAGRNLPGKNGAPDYRW